MEEAKPSKTLKALYSTNDRNKAESVRNEALEVMDNDTSDSDNGRMSSDTSTDEKGNDDFEFGPGKGGQVHNSNPKRELVKFLEKKNEVISFPSIISYVFLILSVIPGRD